MTVSLLLRIERHVPAEEVDWLLPNSELTAVADGAYDPRAREAIHDLRESRVHSIGRGYLVADETSFLTVAVDPAAVHDRLARKSITEEARQAQVGHARNDPFLAGGQREIGAGFSQYVIHHQQMLAATADGEGIDHGNPGLFDGRTLEVVGRRITPSNPTKDLVLVTHHMLEVEQEGDLALIEMGEINAGRAYPSTRIFRMIDRTAPQHCDLRAPIEDGKIDRRLKGCQHRLI